MIYYVFSCRKFQKFSENIKKLPKILKICQKFAKNSLKRRSFLKPSYRIASYREKNPKIVWISYRVEKKFIALHWSGEAMKMFGAVFTCLFELINYQVDLNVNRLKCAVHRIGLMIVRFLVHFFQRWTANLRLGTHSPTSR